MKYFAYGLNLNHKSMKVRCPQAKPLGQHTLHGWQLAFDSVATVVENPKHAVQGGLWEITRKCEKALDELEGYPGWYEKLYADGVMFYAFSTERRESPHMAYLTSLVLGMQDFDYKNPIGVVIDNCGMDIPPHRQALCPHFREHPATGSTDTPAVFQSTATHASAVPPMPNSIARRYRRLVWTLPIQSGIP